MNSVDVDWLVDRIGESVRAGRTPEQAYKEYCKMFSSELVKVALTKFGEKTGRIRTLKEPASLVRKRKSLELSGWYLGPDDEADRYWPPLHKLLQGRGWVPEGITSVDQASTKVLSLLQPPGRGQFKTRGLVLGYIQSGKTANFSAVIAKAADAGYKLFIVLSGLTNPLRNQTQLRLDRELINQNSKNWFALTESDRDFLPGAVGNVNVVLTESHEYKVLGVVKKNASVLRRLLRWLRSANKEVISSCPILIIDDEADQASVNASGSHEKRTAINKLLLDILATLPKVAYVGYTATPFANVFIDPSTDDLYPRDFIIDLPKPVGYFGTEQIFGRERLTQDEPEQEYDGLDMIRHIGEKEIPFLTPPGKNARSTFEPELTTSLKKALRYFYMATSARYVRGGTEEHSTMLIHTSLYIEVHERFQQPVKDYQSDLLTMLRGKKASLIEEFRRLWDEEQSRVPPKEGGERGTAFDELFPYLTSVIEKSEVVVENSQSMRRLAYGEDAKVQIVIGGNTLSRGLTLEGLVVSYFVRATNAYDTLLQMGRWFGYRPGYTDLPRIWMTEELEGYFYDLATVEQEMRNDIKRYELEGITPEEFAIRIRTHPALSITSRLKMQAAIDCGVSYSDQFLQTILFKHKDKAWLEKNIDAARSLIRQIDDCDIDPEVEGTKKVIFRGVPVEIVFAFLNEYAFHENNTILQENLLGDYIQAQNMNGELLSWNVVVVGRETRDQDELIDLGLDQPVPLLTRSRFKVGPAVENYANLKAIASKIDRVADLDISNEKLDKDIKVEVLQSMRPPDIGLLLLYPITKDSVPKSENDSPNSKRARLEAVEHVIGIALDFPKAKIPTPQRYKTVDLSNLVREEQEWPEEEDSNI